MYIGWISEKTQTVGTKIAVAGAIHRMQKALIGEAVAQRFAAHKCYMLVYSICVRLLEMLLSRISLTRID